MNVFEVLLKKLKDPGPFKPCAVYDSGRDIIHVITRECSVSEVEGIMSILTLLEAKHPMRNRYGHVGFNFFKARRFCAEHNLLDGQGFVDLHRILDQLALMQENGEFGRVIFMARQSLYQLFPNTKVQLV